MNVTSLVSTKLAPKSQDQKGQTGPCSAFKLEETPLSLEELPSDVILVHATNCLGEWGAGIAKAIAKMFPKANEKYAEFCNEARGEDQTTKWPIRDKIVGKCYLIEPQEGDYSQGEAEHAEEVGIDDEQKARTGQKRKRNEKPSKIPKVWIACLFTSYGYGRAGGRGRGRRRGGGSGNGRPGKDSTEKIIEQTRTSLKELRIQLDQAKSKGENVPMEIYSPQFNSGSFKVPWEKTEEIIFEEFDGWEGRWYVMRPPK